MSEIRDKTPAELNPEAVLRDAVSHGDGFESAGECERACRWALTEIEQTRAEAGAYLRRALAAEAKVQAVELGLSAPYDVLEAMDA